MTESEADVDSRVILDQVGAEKLLSDGDMLISKNATTERVQCGFISSHEIDALTTAISNQKGPRKPYNTPYYLPEPKDDNDGESEGTVDMHRLDARFEEAARLVVTTQKGSTTYVQMALGICPFGPGRVTTGSGRHRRSALTRPAAVGMTWYAG